jgi:hypothetical protein
MENQAKELVDKIAELEAKTTVKIEGEDISFRYSEILLSNQADRAKRNLIDDARNSTTAGIFNPMISRYWESVHGYARGLGYGSYRELIENLKCEDFSWLERQVDHLLESTGELYTVHFGSILKNELGIKLGDSRKSDFAYLKRASKFDRYFKKEILVHVFKDTLREMGFDIDSQPNIIFDVEERKNKSPRAFCATVKVPEEIYLVVMPRGGQDDYEAILHEGGHAEHFANTKGSLDFEYKFLGDYAVTEGYAFTLEHLMQNSQWLMHMFGLSPEDAGQFVYFSNIMKLWFCRRYAAKFKYELILHDGGTLRGKDAVYRDLLESANKMEYSGSDYLKDVDESFYCTNYIRAWIFEAQLKDYMLRKFGRGWFKKKQAGTFLKEIWSYGQKYNPVEILNQLDFKSLDIEYLINSISEGITKNK